MSEVRISAAIYSRVFLPRAARTLIISDRVSKIRRNTPLIGQSFERLISEEFHL